MRLTPRQALTLWGVAILLFSSRVVSAQTTSGTGLRLPSIPPAIPSGIAYFRELISAKPEDREKLLAGKSPEVRRFLETSIRRYEAYPPEERELRLRTMELRYHVTALLRTPTTNRVQRIASVPEHLRLLVENRLKYWDTLSPQEQQEALREELVSRALDISGPASGARRIALNGQSSNQVIQIEQQLVRWQSLPENRREQIQRNFTIIFEFSDEEKAREQLQALPLSPEERTLMEKTVADFRKLPVAARLTCIRNFPKFAGLSPQERLQFLSNAQEWQKMSPDDRQTWRKLVGKIPRLPPLPPGFGLPPKPRLAPMPTIAVAQESNNTPRETNR